MSVVFAILFFLLSPAGVLWLCRRFRILGSIGPVLILYFLGFVFGNVFDIPGIGKVHDVLPSVMIPLAIPLLLFQCGIAGRGAPLRGLWLPKREGTHLVGRIHAVAPRARRSGGSLRNVVLAMVTGLVSVLMAIVAGYLLFGKNLEDGEKIGAMFTGCYTGGTVNLAAIKTMLGVSDETFILVNSCDMLVCFLYLTFLLAGGFKLFRRFLDRGVRGHSDKVKVEDSGGSYSFLLTAKGWRQLGIVLGVDAVIVGISAGLGLLCGQAWFMTVFILVLTTLGIAVSFWEPVRKAECSYDTGMYFIYVFSVTIASMADLSKYSLSGSLNLLCYMSVVIFGSLLLQILFAKLFSIDADMATVTSVTYICSPPFVPMIAGAMKNKSVLAPALTIGVIGYAVGNYLGFAIFHLLLLL